MRRIQATIERRYHVERVTRSGHMVCRSLGDGPRPLLAIKRWFQRLMGRQGQDTVIDLTQKGREIETVNGSLWRPRVVDPRTLAPFR